jgi:hypothetical protein
MNRLKHRPSARLWCGLVAMCLSLGVPALPLRAQSVPQYAEAIRGFSLRDVNEGQVAKRKNGRPGRTRTSDLFRVKEAL